MRGLRLEKHPIGIKSLTRQSSSPTSYAAAVAHSNYLLAINLHITATLHSIGIPYLSNYHGTSSHVLHSLELDVDTNYLEPKVSKPNGLVRSGDRYRDGDIESAREWVVLLLSCLCLSLPSHTVDRPLSEERSSSVRPGISSSSIRVKLIFDSSVLPRRS
jgi:hypothetical protein